MSEKEPPVPDDATTATPHGGSAAGTPPGSPLEPPSGTPLPPATGAPGAAAPGPFQQPGYPQPGYQQPGYPAQQPGYPQQGYPQQQSYPHQGYPQQQGYPAQGYPPQYPVQQQGYPQPGYLAQVPGRSTPPRPPLAPRQKRGAMLAGAVGFSLMSLGFTLVAVPLAIAAFGAFFSTLFSWAVTNNPDDISLDGGLSPEGIQQFVSDAWVMFLPWLIGLVILGIILWILGLLASLWILRSHRVHRPTAVTWSALGIAVVASFLLSALSSPLSGLFSLWTPDVRGPDSFGGPDGLSGLENVDFAPFIGLGVLFLLLALLVNAAIGLLSWWWMAHAFRERPDQHPAPAQAPLA